MAGGRHGNEAAGDDRLIEAFMEGRIDAIRAVSDLAKSVVQHKVWGFDDAEDIVQATLLALVQNLRAGKYKSGNFPAYVRTIAKNICITDYRRQQARGVHVPLNDDVYLSTVQNPGKKVERRAALNMVLDRLNKSCRQILLMAYVQGYSRREIAEFLGIKEQAVRVRLFRCAKSARAFLEGPVEPSGQHA
jgi:RNA polymerase sigma-70 factor (ECF subfamily)